ncbi:MAG TPA: biopolymer transporter ExbD [Burkholderiaceae bacterium]|nr:biopolymer transporter ExbD [Burkholderiaceae bacterium]
MAFGRLERSAGSQPMSDINMTPLIDVMLVLLVIFMVTAPLMASSLKLDLPASDAAQPSDTPKFIAVAITPEGELYLDEEKLDAVAFDARLAQAASRSPDIEVRLRADKRTPYGDVAELIGRLQKAGLNRIAFVTEPVQAQTPGPAGPR